MRMRNLQRERDALFGPADARGNNPHGTYESSDAEGRRLNAGRYETVGQMDQALDTRARNLDERKRVFRPVGATAGNATGTAGSAGGIFGALLLIGLGALLGYVITRKGGDEEEDEDLIPLPLDTAPSAPVIQPVVVPQVASQVAPQVVPVVPIMVNPVVVEAPKKRRRRAAALGAVGAVGAVSPVVVPTIVVSPVVVPATNAETPKV